MYRVKFLPSVAKTLERLPISIGRRVARAIDALADEPRPRGAAKLRGSSDSWRLRVGDYRVLYEIRDEVLTVVIIKVGHRRDIYRGSSA